MDVMPSWSVEGTYDLKAGSQIGIVALPTCQVLIRPKVPAESVLFLVSYALDPAKWQHRETAYSQSADVVEGMVALFAREVRSALSQGLLQKYRSLDESLATIRGRIRIDEQIRRRFAIPIPVEVSYDDFTVDNPINRVIRAAMWAASRFPIRSRVVLSNVAYCSSLLADAVSLVRFDRTAIPVFAWNRLNVRYRTATELALLILRSTSIELDRGENLASGFLIDMDSVFEEFLRISLREALGLSASAFPGGGQRRVVLDEAGRVGLEPDLSWWRNEQCIFVGDAKYKRVSAAGVTHPDLYQLLAYVVALDLDDGLLVYAVGEAERVQHRVVNLGRSIHVTTVDLSGSPASILADVRRIAERVKGLSKSFTA